MFTIEPAHVLAAMASLTPRTRTRRPTLVAPVVDHRFDLTGDLPRQPLRRAA